ncbi:TonB-dependent receptor [Zhongshania sp. BJYM1]|uniref:TonB-dependent receptor n=1 Tax=Zhongshania aquatica TaxID=2965069 RepID=UPI0022B51A98|nr:TonB-dependent receptor [Marortus sp. BJYM1]
MNFKRSIFICVIGIITHKSVFAATLEEVIVTAQKRSESLQEVPIAVQALGGEALDEAGIGDTLDLQLVTPGFVVSTTGPASQMYLRGIGNRLALAGLDPSVAIYMDDQYIGVAQAGLFEFADVERIEVLKGPQGTLYGRNASGGAIRIVTKGVDDELNGKLSATLGNYNTRKFSGTVSVPLSDSFGVRLSALTSGRDGYADNISTEGLSELDDGDFSAYRVKAAWRITDTIDTTLSLGMTDQDDTNSSDLIVLGPPEYSLGLSLGGVTGTSQGKVGTSISDKTKTETSDAALRINISGETVDFSSITTYWDFEQNGSLELDGTSARALEFFGIPQETESFSQELQWLSIMNESWDWVAGLYYYEQESSFEGLVDRSDTAAVAGGPSYVSQGYQNAETLAYAAFGQTTYHLDDSWSLTLGGRYNYEEKKAIVRKSKYVAVTVTPEYSDKQDWTEFTPKATLQYTLEDEGMVYFTFARGFKSGGYNYTASTINPITGEPEPPVDPELLDMYEFGWKTELMDNRFRLNGSLYYYDYQDLQVTANTTDPSSGVQANITRNAANAEVLGLDLEFTLLVGEYWTLNGAFNFMDSEYQDFIASAQMYNGVLNNNSDPGMSAVAYDASGHELLRAPDFSGYMTISYDIPVSSGRAPVSVTYSYKSSYKYDFIADTSTSALEQDAYGILNARASYYTSDDKWQFTIWGKNLLDEDNYYDDINANPAGIRGSVGAPITYGIELGYHF